MMAGMAESQRITMYRGALRLAAFWGAAIPDDALAGRVVA